jgi:hypothetical protein
VGLKSLAISPSMNLSVFLPSAVMTETTEARNELEKQLAAAQTGEITSEDLLNTLLQSQVFMPVEEEKAAVLNVQRSNRAQPLVLTAEDGTPILVLFSSPERAKDFTKDYPGYGGGLLAEFTWVLEKMGSGYGIALNPGSELGFDMEPQTVEAIIAELSAPKH